MKKIIYILSIFLATGFISCDNFLDITPVGKVIPTTATEFRALMTQAYVSTPKSGRARTAFRSDEVGSFTDTESRSLYFEEWTWDDYSPDYSSDFGWRQYYQALFLINYTIENENKMTGGSKEEIAQLVGEAYAMRAYCFFKLLQYFAPYKDNELGIPVCLETYEDFESVTLERSTQKEVYRQILSDLKEAEMRLQSTPTRESYNLMYCEEVINRLYAQVYHFKAMSAAAEEEDWKNAIVYAERETNGKELESNPEELKALFNVGEGYSLKSQESPLRVKYGGSMGFGTLFSNKKPNETFRQAYFPEENGDIREKLYYQIVEYFDWGSFQTVKDLKINKYSSYDGWGGDYYYLFCAFRLAETFLIQAEAYVRTEQLEKAQTILRRFKEARYTEAFQIPNTKEALLDEILWERQKEFVAEGDVRWLDMKRLGVKTERTIGGETFKLNGYEDYRYAFPIPLSEINNNKYIEQNPGWILND